MYYFIVRNLNGYSCYRTGSMPFPFVSDWLQEDGSFGNDWYIKVFNSLRHTIQILKKDRGLKSIGRGIIPSRGWAIAEFGYKDLNDREKST